ncbi:MAG: NAD(P)H-hydrate epimerase, partial [Candidatus Lokiarchaeota archaeon]|nr:NAD(P)H-hydrate epimerase [Candidatus Lokiarchaeota archaeon]
MGLPGITREEMTEVDRIMVEDFRMPVELMMEHAGLNLANLALNLSKNKYSNYIIIAGSGNNAGGGIVAARRLASWGLNVQVIFPRGENELKDVPNDQFIRVKKLGIEIVNELPDNPLDFKENSFFIDAYLGYGFTPHQDDISENVFNFLSQVNILLSLDIPSGLDATTGGSYSGINPIATLTLGFVKQGLLITERKNIGELYIADIGIPISIYYKILRNHWDLIYKKISLEELYLAFKNSSIQKVKIIKNKVLERSSWT